MKHEESRLQRDCVAWFRFQHPDALIFAIPNGGRRAKIEAAIMKGEGVTAGIPDLCILHKGRTAFVELKTATGKLSPAQREMHERIRGNGVDVATCRSVDEFIEFVETFTHC